MKYTVITAVIAFSIALLGFLDNPNKTFSFYKIFLLVLLISLPVLSILQVIEERKLQRERVTQMEIAIRIHVDSNEFEAFRNRTDIQKTLQKSTSLRNYGRENNLALGRIGLEAHYLLKRDDVQNVIKQYVFNELKLYLDCTSKDNKAWIQQEFNGPDKISNLSLVHAEFNDGIYYYSIGAEYKIDIDVEQFKTLKGFNGVNCRITLETPKNFKAFEDIENEKSGREYIHIRLLGPDPDFLIDAFFKSKITRPPSSGRNVVNGEIEISESFYKDYVFARDTVVE